MPESVFQILRPLFEEAARSPGAGERPRYRLLADAMLAPIRAGRLPADTRLPTVRALAGELGISPGTVTHTYQELERAGAIEKRQGRGTFVRAQDEPESKKIRAMTAIDAMLDELASLGFSPRETDIFVRLKIAGREEGAPALKIAVVDCNPEALHIVAQEVATLAGTQVQSLLLDELLLASYRLDAGTELLVTTPRHFAEAAGVFSSKRILRVALAPSRRTVAALAAVVTGVAGRCGIATVSERFAGVVVAQLAELADSAPTPPRFLLGGGNDLAGFLEGLDTLILPDGYDTLCPPPQAALIRRFAAAGGKLVPFRYHIDAGSRMALEQRVAKMMEGRQP